MAELKLKANRAALILEVSEEGEISVNVASPETESEASIFVSDLCSLWQWQEIQEMLWAIFVNYNYHTVEECLSA